MSPAPQFHRARWLPLTLTLAAVLYYAVVYRALSHRAGALDEPLSAARRELAEAMGETNDIVTLDIQQARVALQQTQGALTNLHRMTRRVIARAEFGSNVCSRIGSPFQLVEFQHERQKQLEELQRLAQEKRVALHPSVLNGLPEYSAELTRPARLWAQLALVDHLLTTAIRCQISSVHALQSVPLPQELSSNLDAPAWHQVSARVELAGPAPVMLQFLSSLPLRAGEMESFGLPKASEDKPAIFIDQILLRKQSPDKLDEVRLEIKASAFCPSGAVHLASREAGHRS